MKKTLSITFSAMLMATLLPSPFAKASYQRQQIQEEQQVLQKQIDSNKQKIEKLTASISDKQANIGKLKEENDQLNKVIEKVNKRIEKRQDLLKDRVQVMYKNGGSVDYLDVLFGSKDFGDFLNRVTFLYQITQSDQDVINAYKADQDTLKEKKDKLNSNLEEAKKEMAEIQDNMTELKSTINKMQVRKSNLNEKEKALAAKEAKTVAKKAPVAQLSQSSRSLDVSSSDDSSQGIALPAASMSGSISDVISSGYRWIGRSTYVFGGGRSNYDISHGRFDCSSYIYWAFKQGGISLGGSVPSTSSLVYMGKAVSSSEMKIGDLVFFDTYKRNGHVGIYMGNGRFIGAQSSTGVAVANMNNSYWSSHFRGVVRRVVD